MKKGKSKRFLAGLLAGVMLIGAAPMALASDTSQPFENDTNSSGKVTAHYRIPAIVTLNDGTLVAAADKRNRAWNSTDDYGDIDTRVAISTDNGASWNFSTDTNVNDTGYTGNASCESGTYIDPILATDGKTIYMLVDLFPGQQSAVNCATVDQSNTGVDKSGNLLLKKSGESKYNYYLSGDTIYAADGSESGYGIDINNFDLYQGNAATGTKLGNLFNYNAAFQPQFTSYLVFRKSTDNGQTWSAPQIINGQVKETSDKNFLTAPGKGVVLSDGTVVFPCYHFDYQNYLSGRDNTRTYLIFGKADANGNFTWTRSTGYIDNASEGELVDLGDGTLRFFMRSTRGSTSGIQYADFDYSGKIITDTTSVATNPTGYIGADIGALIYSKTSSKQKVVMVSCGTGTSRNNGYIFTFTLDSSNKMTMVNACPVKSGAYSYSCMTELRDGSIGLLYENGDDGGITYKKLDIDDVTDGKITFDAAVTPDPEPSTSPEVTVAVTVTEDNSGNVSAEITEGYSVTVTKAGNVDSITGEHVAYDINITDASGNPYTEETTITVPVGTLNANKGLYGFVVNDDGTIETVSGTIIDGKFTFTAPHLSVVGVAEQDGISDYGGGTITLEVGQDRVIIDESGNHENAATNTTPDTSIATVKVVGTTTEAKPAQPESITKVGNGSLTTGTYIIGNGSNRWLKLNNGSLTNTTTAADATKWTITNNNGSYTIQADGYYLYHSTYNTNLSVATSTAQYTSNSWSYDDNGFNYSYYSYNSGSYTTVYLRYSNSRWTVGTGTSNRGATYTYTPKQDAVEGSEITTITFHGVYPGKTSVVVGNTRYQIEVVKATKTVSVQVDKSISYTDNSKSTNYTDSNPGVVDVTFEGGKITFTGLAEGETTIETDTTVYTVKVSKEPAVSKSGTVVSGSNIKSDMNGYTSYNIITEGAPVTGLMLSYSENGYGTTSFTIKCVDANGNDISGVTYTSSDPSVATVSADGTITPTKDGNCTIIVTYPDGSITEIPVRVILGDTKSSVSTYRRFTIYSSALYHSELYCAVASGENRDTDWTKLPVGYVIRVKLPYDVNSGIIFAAKPDDGYALTYVGHSYNGTTVADGTFNYIGNVNGTYGKGSEYGDDPYYYYDNAESGVDNNGDERSPIFSSNTDMTAGGNGIYPTDAFEALLQKAVDDGLDAAFHYTKQGDDKSTSSLQLQIISDKLPTMEKKITSVTKANATGSTPYTEGMTIEQGDTINYEIIITTYKTHHATYGNCYGTISYPSAVLTDELVNMINQSVDLPASSTTNLPSISDGENPEKDQTVTVKASFKLSLENFDKVSDDGTLTNTANLEYTYDAQFSKGTAQDKADASAKCFITVPVYVVDFGLPVTLIGRNDVLGSLEITGGTSTNSKSITPTDSGNGIVYTPKDVFGAEADYVQLTLTEGKHYAIRVIPASNVLYDGSYLKETGNGATWTQGDAAATQQSGDQKNTLYGYDEAYAASIGKSLDSAWTISVPNTQTVSKFLTTTFYGNGFDLIGSAGPNTGYVYMLLSGNGVNKLVIVDTSYVGGDGNTTLYQVPLVHLEGLTEGTYTVNILGAYRAEVKASTSAATYSMYSGANAMDDVYAALDQFYAAGYDFDDVEFVYFDEGSALAGMDNASAVYASNTASAMAAAESTARPAGDTVTIDGFRVYRNSDNSAYLDAEQNVKYVNVLDAVQNGQAAYTEFNSEYVFTDRTDYENNGGPQNEIYLTADKSIVLNTNLNEGTLVQVSARAVTGSGTAMNGTTTIASNTEMYYTVTVGTDGTIVIANTGDSMLALGNLKFKVDTTTHAVTAQTLSIASEMLRSYAAGPDQPEPAPDPTPVIPQPTPVFKPDRLTVGVKSINLFRTKVNTVAITTSTDVVRLTVNGKELRPTNSLMVQLGLSRYYTYVLVDTAKKNETRAYEVIAYNADGVASKTRIAKG